MNKKWASALLISAFSIMPSFAIKTENIPNGTKPMFEYKIYQKGDTVENGLESFVVENDFTQEEINSLKTAGTIINEIINNTKQTTPAKINVYHLNSSNEAAYNAYAASDYIEVGSYRTTTMNATINGINSSIYSNIGVGFGISEDVSGWDTSTTISALYQGTLPHLTTVMTHELTHALGLSASTTYYRLASLYYLFTFSEIELNNKGYIDFDKSQKLDSYSRYLRVYDSTNNTVVTPQKGMPIITDDNHKEEAISLGKGQVFDISENAPFFVGPETMKVLSGSDTNSEEIIEKAGGLVDYSGTYGDNERVNGLPINGKEAFAINLDGSYLYQPELSHIELRNSFMSHQNYRNWNTYMEAELALLKDIGYDINLKDFYGKSFYLDNTTANIVDNYDFTKNQAIGVHVYGDGSEITQKGDITTNGAGSFGVRIEGVENTYNIENATIESNGTNSIGLGVTFGKNHNINIKEGSTIKATGEGSSAVSFDFGKNILGEYVEEKGSYIHSSLGKDVKDLSGIDGALVENFNVNGTIEASGNAKNAIYISPNAYVENINIQKNAIVNGDIVSKWNSKQSNEYSKVQSNKTLFTNINIANDYDNSFSGDIDGNSTINGTTYNTLILNNAGILGFNNSDINVYNIKNENTINVSNNVNLSTLDTVKSISGDGNINVNPNATLILGGNTQNIENNIALGNNAILSTINEATSQHNIKGLDYNTDSKLSFDLGDTFNIKETNGSSIQLSQMKVNEDVAKTLADGSTIKIFENSSNAIEIEGSSNVYYYGNKYKIEQDSTDLTTLKATFLEHTSGLKEAAEDITTANYINYETPQPFDGGSVKGDTFEVSGADVDFNKTYNGLTVDGTQNPGGTTIKTGFYGGKDYSLQLQNNAILNVDSSDKAILIGKPSESAIVMNNSTVNLNATKNKIDVQGDITGNDKTSAILNLSGGNIGLNKISNARINTYSNNTILNNQTQNVDWNLYSGMLTVNKDAYLSSNTNSLLFNGGSLDLANNSANKIHLGKLELNNNANINIDIDFASRQADTFVFDDSNDVVLNNNKLIISTPSLANPKNVLTEDVYRVPFVSKDFNNEKLIGNVETINKASLLTPVYKYGFGYEENGTSGNFVFARSNTGTYHDYNPAILTSSVGSTAAYLTQINSYNMAFQNMDMLMSSPKALKHFSKYRNKYASADDSNLMTFDPNQLVEEHKGFWIKPYATYEKINLKNGPKVENTMYATYAGIDSELIELKRGWYSMYSGYIGYNGSHQHFNGVSMYQNGGQIGATGIFYKDRFFAGTTANIGFGIADASNMYGDEDFATLGTGAAIKAGYNIGFNDDKIILQPSLFAGYSFINAFDYTNSAGLRVKPEGIHGFELAPGIKLIGNLPNGWQPYISTQFVWNMLTDSYVKVQSANIDYFKIKPYVQYGIGVQKQVGSLTGYFQSMGRNAGRNGISLQAGFKWLLGEDLSPLPVLTQNEIERELEARKQRQEARAIHKKAQETLEKQNLKSNRYFDSETSNPNNKIKEKINTEKAKKAIISKPTVKRRPVIKNMRPSRTAQMKIQKQKTQAIQTKQNNKNTILKNKHF